MMDISSVDLKAPTGARDILSGKPYASRADTSSNEAILESGFSHPKGWFEKELAEDLAACWSPGYNAQDVNEWMVRPGILRRVARLLAAAVPPDADRIVAVGIGAQVLGTSVSLITGLPFVAVEEIEGSAGTITTFGRVHKGEAIAVISVLPTGASLVGALAETWGVTIVQRNVVLLPSHDTELGGQSYGAMFGVTPGGQIRSASPIE